MHTALTSEIVAIARLCEVDRYALRSPDLFPYKKQAEKLSHVSASALLVSLLVDGTGEKATETESVSPFYRGKFATRGIFFRFANSAWLQYLENRWPVSSFRP